MTETTRTSKPKQAAKPIAAHPMFPAVTALWFATFFGLGSFALAPSLLEGPVVALGIPDIFPPARPPLGFTVRALTALVMFGLGGAIGLMAGRMLARGKVQAPVRNRAVGQPAARRAAVMSMQEDFRVPDAALDTDGIDTVGRDASAAYPGGGHRRPLNPREDLDLADFPADPFALSAVETAQVDDAPALGDVHVVQASGAAEAAGAFTVDDLLPWERDAQFVQAAAQPDEPEPKERKPDPFDLAALLHDAQVGLGGSGGSGGTPPQDPMAPEPATLSLAAAPAVSTPDQSEDTVMAVPAVPMIAKPLFQAPVDAVPPITRTPLDELGLVQLTERLALALARAKHRLAMTAQTEPVLAAVSGEAPAATSAHGAADLRSAVKHALSEPAVAPAQVVMPAAPEQPAAAARADFTVAPPSSEPAGIMARLPGSAGGSQSFAASAGRHIPGSEERVVPLRPAAMQPLSFGDDLHDADEEDPLPGLDRFLRAPEGTPDGFSPLSVKPAKLREQNLSPEDAACEPAEACQGAATEEPNPAEPDVAEDRYPSLLEVGLASLRHKTSIMLAAEGDHDVAGTDEYDDAANAPAQVMAEERVVAFPAEPALPECGLSEAGLSEAGLSEAGLSEAGLPDAGLSGHAAARPFERPAILAVQGSPLAAPGKAAPASPYDPLMSQPADPFASHAVPAAAGLQPDPEEADRALRAALATLQRMTAQG